MGQTPSVRPDESKVTDLEQSMPEITSGNSQGVPVDNNPSVFTAARTKSKIKILHVTIGVIATVIVLLAILIGVVFFEISSLKDKQSKHKENLNENKAAIAELKAKDMKTYATLAALETGLKANKATITSLESQMKSKDNQITKSVNRLKHFEVGRHVSCSRDPNRLGQYRKMRRNSHKTIPFNQSYDTAPHVAVMMDSQGGFTFWVDWTLLVTSVQKSSFTVRCEIYAHTNYGLDSLKFTWISLPKV